MILCYQANHHSGWALCLGWIGLTTLICYRIFKDVRNGLGRIRLGEGDKEEHEWEEGFVGGKGEREAV